MDYLIKFIVEYLQAGDNDGDAIWLTKAHSLDEVYLRLLSGSEIPDNWMISYMEDMFEYVLVGIDEQWLIITDSEKMFRSRRGSCWLSIEF